jgi:hypothetical protein
MKTLNLNPTIPNLGNPKEIRTKELAIVLLIASVILFAPESFAQGATQAGTKDAFLTVYDKLSGWTQGTAGKLITLVTLLFGAVGGVLGFNSRIVFGAIGVGLLLATSTSFVDILF